MYMWCIKQSVNHGKLYELKYHAKWIIYVIDKCVYAQRDAMIANLDKMRHVLEELSPELGVTDPVSGTVVLDYDA